MALLPCVQSGIRYDSEEGEERVLHICIINSESKKVLTAELELGLSLAIKNESDTFPGG